MGDMVPCTKCGRCTDLRGYVERLEGHLREADILVTSLLRRLQDHSANMEADKVMDEWPPIGYASDAEVKHERKGGWRDTGSEGYDDCF